MQYASEHDHQKAMARLQEAKASELLIEQRRECAEHEAAVTAPPMAPADPTPDSPPRTERAASPRVRAPPPPVEQRAGARRAPKRRGARNSTVGDSHDPHHDAMEAGDVVVIFDLVGLAQMGDLKICLDGCWDAPRWDASPNEPCQSVPSAGRTMFLTFRTNSIWKHGWRYRSAPPEGTCRTSLQFTLFVGTGYTEAQIAELVQFVCECPVPA